MSGEKNQVLENMKTRRSIRKYKPDMVPKELLRRLQRLEHTLQLAWASSLQSLLPLQTKELRESLSKNECTGYGIKTAIHFTVHQ